MSIQKGQIVKFHSPLENENPTQQYVVLELYSDTEYPRAKIQALNTGLPFPPINTVSPNDLEVIPVSTADLIGHFVTIKKSNETIVMGRVVSIAQPELIAHLKLKEDAVETNVDLTVKDRDGLLHNGILIVR